MVAIVTWSRMATLVEGLTITFGGHIQPGDPIQLFPILRRYGFGPEADDGKQHGEMRCSFCSDVGTNNELNDIRVNKG